MINIKKLSLIISLIYIIIIGIISIYNKENYDSIIFEINESYINNKSIDKKLENKLYKSISKYKVKKEEKFLALGYLELKKDETKAKEYFKLGIENINKDTCDLTKAYLYKLLSDIMVKENNIGKAIEYAEVALYSIGYNNYKKNTKLICNIIRPITTTKKGRDISVKYLNNILECKLLDVQSKIIFRRLLSAIHILDYNYAEAISLNIEIIDESSKLDDKYYMYKSMIDISLIARDIGAYQNAIKILNFVNIKKVNDKILKSDLEIYKNLNLAQIQNILNKSEDALNSINKITQYEKYIPKQKRKQIECLKNIVIAESYVNINNTDLAKKYLSKAEENIQVAKSSYPDIDIYYSIVLGKINFENKNYEQAIKQFESNLDQLKKVSNKEYEKISILYLLKTYAKINDSENINKYSNQLRLHHEERDDLMLTNYYEFLEYKNDYEKLEDKKNITGYTMITLFIIIVLLVLVILKTIILPYKEKRKAKRYVTSYIKNNNYILNYQPIVNPKTNKIVAFESLIRLKKNDNIIYPNILIDQIELCNMMDKVSIWILKKVIKDYENISKLKNLDDNFYLSMNVSLKEIENELFCSQFTQILKDSNLRSKSICLEITENISGKDYIEIRKNIQTLMDSGFLIAIDDFGVDYSNLSFLEELDFNIIKLDKYFIDNIFTSIAVQSLVDAINYIAIKKDVSIVMEGVEEKNQVESIKEIKSDKFYIQGYYYSKPVEIDKLDQIEL